MTRKTNGIHVGRASTMATPRVGRSPQGTQTAALLGAAVLGGGALAASLGLMRKPLGRLARSAVAEAAGFGEHLAPSHLLSFAGLQRRRSGPGTLGLMAGTWAVGIASGAALGFFLARRGREDTMTREPATEQANSAREPLAPPFGANEAR